jgi:hypothetical protein
MTLLICAACLGLGTAGMIVYGQARLAARVTPSIALTMIAEPAPTVQLPTSGTATPRPAPQNPLSGNRSATSAAPAHQQPPEPASGLDLQPPAAIIQQPVPAGAATHLENLLLADYPIHDFYETSQRLGRYDVGERTVSATPHQVGDVRTFYVDDATIDAVLVAVTEHTYFWVETGLNLDEAAVTAAARQFETSYYPRLINLFGQEWRPGVDNDPHFSILHLNYIDSDTDELGHFNSGDEYPRTFYSSSNEQEIIYLNMSNLRLGSDLYYGTLVHEFQHLVQWYVDANETAWLNEGLSQLAEIYVGLDTADTSDYLLAPNTQLTTWDYMSDNVYAHYGSSYLFAVYLWEQLGEAAVQELARHPANGIASVDAILKGYRPESSLQQFVSDWTVANYLDDEAAGPAYHYRSLDLRPPVTQTSVRYAPFETVEDVPQFSAHYVELDVEGRFSIAFAGDTVATLAPISPHSGQQMWFAPAHENVNAQLTRRFDLSGLDTATLNFWAWYDLKYDLDYAYVAISTDEGTSWELLSPLNATMGEYGPAFNGQSDSVSGSSKGGWVEQNISLDAYTGRPVLIRFELLTYHEPNALGFAIDDISVPELGYATDVETDAADWEASGFVQTGPLLPQQWALQYISNDGAPRAVPLTVDEFNQGRWEIEVGPGGGVLAVNALTPFIQEPASFWLYVEEIARDDVPPAN